MGAGPPALLLGRERDQRPPGNHHETLLPRGRPQGRRAGGQSAYGRVPAGRRPRGRGHRTARSVSVDHSVPAWWEEEAGERGVCVSQCAGVVGRRGRQARGMRITGCRRGGKKRQASEGYAYHRLPAWWEGERQASEGYEYHRLPAWWEGERQASEGYAYHRLPAWWEGERQASEGYAYQRLPAWWEGERQASCLSTV